MIDPDREKLLPINKIPAHVEKRTGKRPSLPTSYRWINRGIAGGIRLEVIAIGGSLYCSEESLNRFFREVTAAKQKRHSPAVDHAPSNRQLERDARKLGLVK